VDMLKVAARAQQRGRNGILHAIYYRSTSSLIMNHDTGPNLFITSTPADFCGNAPNRHGSHTHVNTLARQQEEAEEENGPLRRSAGQVVAPTDIDATNFQIIKRVLGVLKEGGMDVVGFLDTLSWGNQMAIMDPTTKQARTNLMRSDRLATVVSRWLSPPRTSKERKERNKPYCRWPLTR